MDIVFVAINAKYIHTSPAVRLLNECVDRSFDSKYRNLQLKIRLRECLRRFFHTNLNCRFLMLYLEINIVLELARKLKEINKDIIILLGGPS